MAERRILRLDGGLVSVAKESRFDSEGDQHQAIAQHPKCCQVRIWSPPLEFHASGRGRKAALPQMPFVVCITCFRADR